MNNISTTTTSKLFQPFTIGPNTLSSRIVVGPLSRNQADTGHVQDASAKHYYSERAAVPGTLIITERTFPSLASGGSPKAPGIWSREQIGAWREVVQEVHEAGGYIFLQLWALGRAADAACRAEEGTGEVVAPSAIQMGEGEVVPREMTEHEIWTTIKDFATAARNAVEGAGFDGVEVHAANGYLIDQFTQSVSNKRTDSWGGGIQNRSRLGLEVAKAVIEAVGADRVGFRVSPWSTFQGMGMSMKDTVAQFTDLLEALMELKLAYLHLVESRVAGKTDVEGTESLDPFIDLWGDTSPIVLAGGYSPETAKQTVDETYRDKDVAIAFGRLFVTYPDLVHRLRDGYWIR